MMLHDEEDFLEARRQILANILLLAYRTRIKMIWCEVYYFLFLYSLLLAHHPVDPPSTRKSVPVTYELASASKNTTAPRYSSGPEILLSIASCSHTVVHSLLVSTSFVIGVEMTPGLMELTRMAGESDDGEEPHSPARERVSWWTPALEAE